MSLRAYSREPPVTVRHTGRSLTFRKPCRSKKSTKKRAGNERIASSVADQIARPMGST